MKATFLYHVKWEKKTRVEGGSKLIQCCEKIAERAKQPPKKPQTPSLETHPASSTAGDARETRTYAPLNQHCNRGRLDSVDGEATKGIKK